jgi:mitochondrial fission protein ELM1
LSDGRPGHENQSVGLAEALRRRTGAEVELLRFDPGDGLRQRFALATRRSASGTPPDLLIAAGHRTHLPLWRAGRVFGARTVVIMKPSWPAWFFDLCLIPRHDLRLPSDQGRIIATFGALNRLPEQPSPKEAKGLVLIGGPSAHHGWDADTVLPAVVEVVAARPELVWTVADSRRSPADTLGRLKPLLPANAALVPHGETEPGWLPAQLAHAVETWVTEDSVSMIHEAVTAGARTGVLPVPRHKARSRVVRAVEELVAAGYARTLDGWKRNGGTLVVPPPLHETGRCAERVMRKLFPGEPQQS